MTLNHDKSWVGWFCAGFALALSWATYSLPVCQCSEVNPAAEHRNGVLDALPFGGGPLLIVVPAPTEEALDVPATKAPDWGQTWL